jgi:hypothetical protein
MPHLLKSPDSPDLTFICGLGWPKMERYYLSRRYPGCWDFWVLAPGKKKARQLFARLEEASTAEDQVAFESLDFFLEKHRKLTLPEKGVLAEGLLSEPMIQTVLMRHRGRGQQKYGEMYSGMLGLMWEFMDEEEYDELMRDLTKEQEPEEPPARVLPFPPQEPDDEGEVN